jgi:regulation of enolase protein 1 (concanavalin A-like superfamily)
MIGRNWRISLAILTLSALVLAAGSRPVGAQRSSDGPAKPHFVSLEENVVNLDHIQFITVSKSGRVLVFFADRSLSLNGKDAEQLLAAVRDQGQERAVPPSESKQGSRFLAIDEFDGKFTLNWKPVRPDPSHVSLEKTPGMLTIRTQRGTIHGEETRDELGEGIRAKNLYLIDNPLAPNTDFVVTTCVSGFTPEMSFQQAGLIIYNDDDNYLKFGYEFDWRKEQGQTFIGVAETLGVPLHYPVESESGLKRYWLRLTKRGDRYEFASSLDGKEFRVHGEATWGDGSPKRIGLVAKNGGNKDAGEMDANFEFFELKSPPEPSEPRVPGLD